MVSPQPAQSDVQELMMLMQAGKFAKVEALARKHIKKFPSVLGFYDVMSKAQIGQEDFRGVVKTLEKALKVNPEFVDGEYNLGVAYMNLNKPEKSLACFANVIAKRPQYFEAYNNMGACNIELQRFDKGIAAYRKAVELKSDFVPALRNLGTALRDMGRVEEAEAVLVQIPKLQPGFALGHFSLGVAQAELGKRSEAIASFEEAIRLQPDMSGAHYELGRAFKENGNLQEALECFRKVDNMVARVQVLEALHELGKKEELLQSMKELNKAEPKNLRAAAFSAYVSHQYGVENSHPFCSNPMDFVSVRDISVHLKDNTDFLSDLMVAADDLTTVWEHATTKGGLQTHGNLFDPTLENKHFEALEKVIRKELRNYRDSFKGKPDGLLKGFPKEFSLRGWRVKLMKAGYQKPHIHSSGWVSGVLYLKVPKKLKENEGSIAFSLHGYDYCKERDGIPYKEHMPCEGELVLFPSSLFHWTIPFDSDEERQCIAFDVVPA